MKYSFIIRTFNEGSFLSKTLDIINNLETNEKYEIIIVDSNSTDNTIDIAKSFSCNIIRIPRNKWSWGYSLNEGIRHSSGNYLIIISAHCYITNKNFLNTIENLFNKFPVCCIYGQQIPIKGYDCFEEIELLDNFPDYKEYLMNKDSNIIGVSNACAVVKKEIWNKIAFNEIVESLEDGYWAREVLKKENQILYTSLISVFHSHPFNPHYIYRKWYWRTYELLCFNKYKPNFIIIELFKKIYKAFWWRTIELYKFNKRLNHLPHLSIISIYIFLKIKNHSIMQAKKDFIDNKKSSYWDLSISSKISFLQQKLCNIKHG